MVSASGSTHNWNVTCAALLVLAAGTSTSTSARQPPSARRSHATWRPKIHGSNRTKCLDPQRQLVLPAAARPEARKDPQYTVVICHTGRSTENRVRYFAAPGSSINAR